MNISLRSPRQAASARTLFSLTITLVSSCPCSSASLADSAFRPIFPSDSAAVARTSAERWPEIIFDRGATASRA